VIVLSHHGHYVQTCPFDLIGVHSNADLQLDVKGCQDVYASFDKYVEVERLEGDNKYHAEQYGLQVRFLGASDS
jgi:ubiquitin carboxyl-terminal hydrolase 7